jgi:putative SOS response-associated peptidase YedK
VRAPQRHSHHADPKFGEADFASFHAENWKEAASGQWIRTFAIITTDANALVADIHDRMPVLLAPADYPRWLGEESDPRDLMRQFPADLMRMWPISTRVNKPKNLSRAPKKH